MPPVVGISSENVGHRVAMLWEEGGSVRQVFSYYAEIQALSLTCCWVAACFPGEHHLSSFYIQETGAAVSIKMKSADEAVTVEIEGNSVLKLFLRNQIPKNSIEFDNALIMRNVPHEWQSDDDSYL